MDLPVERSGSVTPATLFLVTFDPGGDLELERQRAEIEAAFSHGWGHYDDGEPRILTEREYVAARRVLDIGAWTGQATVQAVRDGARPGDVVPPPPPSPFINHVTNTSVILTGSCPGRRVTVLFSHDHFPGVRFGHRFPLEPYEGIWLMEAIDTGALHRMMDDPPPPDSDGIVWTTWGSPAQ